MLGRPGGAGYNPPINQQQPIPSTSQRSQLQYPAALESAPYPKAYYQQDPMQLNQPEGLPHHYPPVRETTHPYSQTPSFHSQQPQSLYSTPQYSSQPIQQHRQPPQQQQRQHSGNQWSGGGEYYGVAPVPAVHERDMQGGQRLGGGGGDARTMRDPRMSSESNRGDGRGAAGTSLVESRQALNSYILDYFRKQGFHSAAQALLQDAPATTQSAKGKGRSVVDQSEEGLFSNGTFAGDSPRNSSRPDGIRTGDSIGSSNGSTTSHFGFNTSSDSTSSPGFSPRLDVRTLPNASVSVETHQGLLLDWWAVFWDGFRARGGNGGNVASAFVEGANASIEAAVVADPNPRSIPARPLSVASNLASTSDFLQQGRPSSRNEQMPSVASPNHLPTSTQPQRPPSAQQLQQQQIRDQHRIREQRAIQLSQAAQAAARTHVNPPQFPPIPLNAPINPVSTQAMQRQAMLSRRGGLVNVAPPPPPTPQQHPGSHEAMAGHLLRQQQQQRTQLDDQTRQNELYSISIKNLQSNYHQTYSHIPPQHQQTPQDSQMKPAGQPYDPSYEAQMLRAHEMALRGNAGQQALTETHAKAIDVLSQADQRNTSGNFKLKDLPPRLTRPPLVSNNSAPLLQNLWGASAVPADYIVDHPVQPIPHPRPTSAGPSTSNYPPQNRSSQQQEMPPPVVVAAPRRHASAGSTPKALTPIATAESPGASSSTIKRKREVKDCRETKRRSAAMDDRPRSNSASSNPAVTPTSTVASPALSVGSPYVSSAQSPLPLAISLEMPRINIDDSAASIAPPEEMYELFGFGSNSETQIPLDSSFFDLYCNDLSVTD